MFKCTSYLVSFYHVSSSLYVTQFRSRYVKTNIIQEAHDLIGWSLEQIEAIQRRYQEQVPMLQCVLFHVK